MNGLRAVIMAGGRSERMRATNGPLHKALVTVAQVPLIERNLRLLFAHDITDVVVVTAAEEPAIRAYLATRGREVAARYGARVASFVETRALGNIGVAAELANAGTDLLVLYVDNLCSLDLRALVAHHRAAAAALTIATHSWVLRNPFGELEIVDGRVVAYREKPVRTVRISSGTCVVGPAAAEVIPRGTAFGASELFAELHRRELTVAAFEHAEPWIDVNDAAAVQEAEALVLAHPERFA